MGEVGLLASEGGDEVGRLREGIGEVDLLASEEGDEGGRLTSQ